MAKRKVFYSFHFDNDVFRVQQIRNMGILEGVEPTTPNMWEEIKRSDRGVQNWIDQNLNGKSCLVVLIGSETAKRKWVLYEIQRAWELGKTVIGINIHNLKCPRTGYGKKGENPFKAFTFERGGKIVVPPVYNPKPDDAYADIKANLSIWLEDAINN